MIDTGKFYLGGFGFGSGKTVINDLNSSTPSTTRAAFATASCRCPVYGASTRAMALGDGKHAMVTAQIETQGYFLAYKNGDYGIVDIRREAAAQIAQLAAAHPGVNALPARSIVVDSNHSHGGPDTAGVWGGGVPVEYLQLVKDQTVKAIVEAWQSLQPVDLYYGKAQALVSRARRTTTATRPASTGSRPTSTPTTRPTRSSTTRSASCVRPSRSRASRSSPTSTSRRTPTSSAPATR